MANDSAFRGYDLVAISASEQEASYTLRFKSQSGDSLSVEVPAENFLGVFPQLQQLWLAASLRKQSGPMSTHGTWRQTPLVEVETVHVETVSMASPPAVAIVFDLGSATQVGFQLPARLAPEVAAVLLNKAEECSRGEISH